MGAALESCGASESRSSIKRSFYRTGFGRRRDRLLFGPLQVAWLANMSAAQR
jgi:hypothetical protein